MKRLTVRLSNNELDALEDILWAELSGEELKKSTMLAGRLWRKLAREYDKDKND